MTEFNDEDELLAYRRLCIAIADAPLAWARFCSTIIERRELRGHGSTYGRKLFEANVEIARSFGARIAREEKRYWESK
jgi:hypothetical protein